MNKKYAVSTVIALSAFLGMGMSMPSCPGQQEMKDQVTALQAQNGDLAKKIQAQEAKVKQLTEDMNTIKTALPQVVSTIQAQKTGLDQLDSAIKELQSKSSSKGKTSSTSKKKK